MIAVTEKSQAVVELPLLMFLRIADGDGQMTAREMERFDALLQNTSWCQSDLLQRALPVTQAEKGALWARYAKGQMRADIGSVAAALDTVMNGTPADGRALLVRDLLHFCRSLLKTANREAGLLRSDGDAKTAFAELSDLLNRPPVRPAADPTIRIPATTGASPLDRHALLTDAVGPDLFWDGGKLPLRCVHIVDETHDVKSFHFVADPPRLFRYHPGQFLTFELPIEGQTVRRSYTISSSPSRPCSIAVTVKRVESGIASNWLHDTMRAGAQLFADGPNGKFTCINEDAGPYLFISGGSGITPTMSMCRWLTDTTPGVDIHFVHFARSPKDLIFEQELRLMERQLHRFRCDFVCSRPEEWTGPSGRISPALMSELAKDLKRRAVYLCGPVPFMESARGVLEGLQYGMDRFRQESFGGVPRKPVGEAAQPAEILFKASGKRAACETIDYVLDIALQNGVAANYSCRAGQCGACKITVLEGATTQDCTDALTDGEAKLGIVLACQARPSGRIVVDL